MHDRYRKMIGRVVMPLTALSVFVVFSGCTSGKVKDDSSVTSFSNFEIKVFTSTVWDQQHPTGSVTVPDGYKVIGGGVLDYWQAGGYAPYGNMLTASYPDLVSNKIWHAAGKDQGVKNITDLMIYAIALYDPQDKWDVKVFSSTSDHESDRPQATVSVTSDYRMTGGGAKVNWTGYGNLLISSIPGTKQQWNAHGWWQGESDPSTITAYAIGIKPRDGSPLPDSDIQSVTSSEASHPKVYVKVADGYRLTGGGAHTIDWTNHSTGDSGNYLTFSLPASCHPAQGLTAPPPNPVPDCVLPTSYTSGYNYWIAGSKDHSVPNPAKIMAYAIGLK